MYAAATPTPEIPTPADFHAKPGSLEGEEA